MSQEVFLGYDVRTSLEGHIENSWDTARRSDYLLRPEIIRPVSVDRIVWPSLLTDETPPFGLLTTLDEVVRSMKELERSVGGEPTLIGIFGFPNRECTIPAAWSMAVGTQPTPECIHGVTKDLGFDVADEFMLGGLSNCKITPEERGRICESWIRKVNMYGLLEDLESASMVKTVYDLLVPEHSPFYVYFIQQIRFGPVEGPAGTGLRCDPRARHGVKG